MPEGIGILVGIWWLQKQVLYCLVLREHKNLKLNMYWVFGKMQKIWKHHGGVAQLGEHLPCKQGVRSSILLVSTKFYKGMATSHDNMGL